MLDAGKVSNSNDIVVKNKQGAPLSLHSHRGEQHPPSLYYTKKYIFRELCMYGAAI